tara:strand:- start:962 stop:1306 length:345 start_codon:yes stop_codon:yes gene_type:complete
MDFPVFLNKFIIGNKYLRYYPIWYWYRLISHQGFRFDDYYVWGEFWHSLNHGWEHIQYVNEFEKVWGKGSYPPEKIILSQRDFDALQERLNADPDPKVVERFREIMNKKPPWND